MLDNLGLTDELVKAFADRAARGLTLARVLSRDREHCRVRTAAAELPAEIAGALWYRADRAAELPVTGDWVAARTAGAGLALVEEVLPRRTAFSRRAAGRRETEQVVAANVDVVFLVMGLDGDFNPRRLERYLTLAAESGAAAVIVLNKADLCDSLDEQTAAVRAVAPRAHLAIAAAASGRIDAVRGWLARGRTVALLGSSGAGKSTIVNGLLGETRQHVRPVRASDSRGRHTTTRRELFEIPGLGAVIDTPGLRELQLWAPEESVDELFEDIRRLAGACRFSDCSHTVEGGCAVSDALAAGALDADRWEGYRKLLGEAQHNRLKRDALARQQEKQRWKAIHRAQRDICKRRAPERPI
jgi:ribosome biogenesis GTPase / thiamine phosphate phosphatase